MKNKIGFKRKQFSKTRKIQFCTSLCRLQFSYGTDPIATGDKLGFTDSGLQVKVTMMKDEYIQEMSLDFTSTKPFLTRLFVKSNLRIYGPFGGHGAQKFDVKGSKLMFVEGKSGPLVDQLTFYFDKCS